MGRSLLFSLLLALTIVPEASTTTTTTSSTTAGSTAITPMMSSTTAGSTASTPMMSSTASGSTPSTTMMSSTTAGSTASTPMMSSTASASTPSTAMESSTAAGSTTSNPMVSSTTAATLSTAARATATTTMIRTTPARATATTTMIRTTPARATASTTMIRTTPARATGTTTTRSTAASTNATGPTNPPVLTPNSTVERLPSPISNAGCGSSLLCAGAPESCDPSMAGSCFFVGTKRTAGQNFEFSLSGESEGYIGCTLSTDSLLGGGDITFICANNKGTLEFIGASLNNSALSRQTVNANSVKGHINGTKIQCTFKATVPAATARGSATSFALAVVNGTYSPGTDELGAPEAKVQTKVLDITDTNSSTTSILTPGVNSGRPTHQALSEALLIIIATMGLALI